MALTPAEVRDLVREKGWSFADLAARWKVSVSWMSHLVNNPHERAPAYDDAFRGLPYRAAVQVVRQPRHVRRHASGKPRSKPRLWTHDEMYPSGRIFEATDNKVVEEGTRLECAGRVERDGVGYVQYFIMDGHAAGDSIEVTLEEAACHLQDIGLDVAEANVQR